jgi:thiamine biosynthesis lipoprotein
MMPNRRRFLTLFAAAGAAPAILDFARRDGFVWRGTALGADAEMRIAGLDKAEALRVVHLVTQEVERLEAIFSLYRPDSELSKLNRDGFLSGPSHDFRLLLEQSLAFWKLTDGAFNPAIQPVWSFLARHFAKSSSVPDADELHAKLRLCDPSALKMSAARIAIAPGMALTFNGIAQGYITDAAARILEGEGLSDILIGLGEFYALPGKSWRVGIAGSDTILDLAQRAVAQSAGRGTLFTPDGRWHHLIDPRTGSSANHVKSVTVSAPSATLADALSTALGVTPPRLHAPILAHFPEADVYRDAVDPLGGTS